jgi:type IV pilus assembly protein PilQ
VADADGKTQNALSKDGTMPIATIAQILTKVETQVIGDDIAVVLSGDGVLGYEMHAIGDRRLVCDITNVQSSVAQSQLAVGHSILKRIRFGQHPDGVRLVFDLARKAQHSIESAHGRLIITLKSMPSISAAATVEHQTVGTQELNAETGYAIRDRQAGPSVHRVLVSQRTPKSLLHVRPVQLAVESDQKSEPKIEQKEESSNRDASEFVTGPSRYTGRRISLDFQQADISNVLRLIAEVSGFNIVVGEGVKNKVTMKLANVPWDQALDMLLKMNGLGMIRQGNIVWVDSLTNIAKQQDEEARAKESKAKAEPIVTRVFYIRNLNAQEVQQSLRQYMSPRGVMNISQASNALIVSDTETKIAVMRQLVDGLDLEVPQVQIEARIVQADTTYTRSLGVQWGIQNINQMGAASGTSAFRTGTTGAFGAQASDFLVNLPANPGFPSVPGAGFTIGKTDGALLDVRLSAGELLGLTKVIAAPKVTTLDKRDAKIAQGESIPFQTTSLQGTQTTFVDANLELNVTPQITSRDPKEIGKLILMKVRATRNAVGARSNPAGPSIDRREATTQVLVRDGETMVIGGVFVDTQLNNVAGIPYLSRVPVLGWLFKQKTENVSKTELLIFLTPTIVKTTS